MHHTGKSFLNLCRPRSVIILLFIDKHKIFTQINVYVYKVLIYTILLYTLHTSVKRYLFLLNQDKKKNIKHPFGKAMY